MSLTQCANRVFLTPTDTTVGFISQNADRLTELKERPPHKHYIKALPSLRSLRSLVRVPERHKNRVRRAKRTTFVFPNSHSYRVVKDHPHQRLIRQLGWAYTTSANISGEAYDETFAKSAADIVVAYPFKRSRHTASKIYRLNNSNIRRLR